MLQEVIMKIKVGRCLIPDLLKGRSQRWLATTVGISESHLSHIISKSRKGNIETLKLLAINLDCCIDDLFEWEWV
jgi:DNA-binding Xre family transcriptional regulator